MKMRRTVYLPEDLLLEILSRVPVKSLARLRSTSKRWNALVKGGILLAKKHSANAPRDSAIILMVADFRVHLLSIDLHGNVNPSAKVTSQFSLKEYPHLEQVDVRDAYHCDGLLVCITKDNRLVVWNPCTGETKWIQARNSCKKTDYYALGYDNKSSCYKILSINQHHFNPSYSAYINPQVYDFASESWRNVCSNTEWFIPRERSRGMSLRGTTYWLVVRHPYHDCFLLSFDFSTERFQRLSLPAEALNSFCKMALSVTREEQKLCLLSTNRLHEESKSYVWIANKVEKTGAVLWSKFHRLHLRIRMRVFHDHNNKSLLCCKNDSLGPQNMLHIVGEDKYIQMVDPTCPVLLLTYVPSLVQIQQGT